MMKIDLLEKISKNEVSEDEAEQLLETAKNSGDCWSILSMNQIEVTAYAYGALFEEIARWRYGGWPQNCARCGEALKLAEGGWIINHDHDDSRIMHVDCQLMAKQESVPKRS